jgi:predicted MPP superfamily phosphohydrolase
MCNENIFAISDLHVDAAENMRWVEDLSSENYVNDTLIVAGAARRATSTCDSRVRLLSGDVTHDLSKLASTLNLLKSKFKDVYFCPGNHELWIRSKADDHPHTMRNSIEKFHYVPMSDNDNGSSLH